MNTQVLNKICFMICIVSIVAGMAVAMVMLWAFDLDPVLWRLLATIAVVFFGSFATLSVSRTYMPQMNRSEDKPS